MTTVLMTKMLQIYQYFVQTIVTLYFTTNLDHYFLKSYLTHESVSIFILEETFRASSMHKTRFKLNPVKNSKNYEKSCKMVFYFDASGEIK